VSPATALPSCAKTAVRYLIDGVPRVGRLEGFPLILEPQQIGLHALTPPPTNGRFVFPNCGGGRRCANQSRLWLSSGLFRLSLVRQNHKAKKATRDLPVRKALEANKGLLDRKDLKATKEFRGHKGLKVPRENKVRQDRRDLKVQRANRALQARLLRQHQQTCTSLGRPRAMRRTIATCHATQGKHSLR
jgi:hypothetical protein